MDKNAENKKKALDKLKDIAKDKAKGLVKKTPAYEKAKEVAKDSPVSLKALGAVGVALAKKAAIKAEKTFKTSEKGSITIKGEYNPRTKEKKIGAFYNRSF